MTMATPIATRTAKKQWLQISKTKTLHVHHAFLYISLLSLHDYDVKMPDFTFYYIEDVNTQQQFPFSSPELQYRPLKFNSRKMLHYLLN